MKRFFIAGVLQISRVTLLLGMAALAAPANGQIVISEIMFNPQGTDLDTSVTPNISRDGSSSLTPAPPPSTLADGDSAIPRITIGPRRFRREPR